MELYATPADLAADPWNLTPDNASALLRAASILVGAATAGDVYVTDRTTHLPTDSSIIAAMRDATCSQAAMWSAAGIDPSGAGLATPAGTVVSKSMNGRAVTYAAPDTAVAQGRTASIRQLGPQAFQLLRQAGLCNTAVLTA